MNYFLAGGFSYSLGVLIFGACVGGIPGKQISGQFSREVIKEIRSKVSGNNYSFSADLLEGGFLIHSPNFGLKCFKLGFN